MSTPESGAGRRLLVATAIAHYANNPAWDRPGLAAARDQIIGLFTIRFGYTHLADVGLDPTAAQLQKQLRSLCRNQVSPSDYLVVYIAGHGEILDDGGHVLLTADADPDDIDDALPTVTLAAKMLRNTPVQRLMLLLDTCYSGRGGNEMAAAALTEIARDWTLSGHGGLVIVTSSQRLEQAGVGVFPQLLAEAIDDLPTAGQDPSTLDIGALVAAMNRNRNRSGYQRIGWTMVGSTGQVPDFLPNPRHQSGLIGADLLTRQIAEWEALASQRDLEFRRRFLVRAMATPDQQTTVSWWFAGRHAALTEITTWLNNPRESSPAMTVTAGPGSGKTAVLGVISALCHPNYVRTVPISALGLTQAQIPAVGAVEVTIYAGDLTTTQVLAGLAAAAKITTVVRTASELTTALTAQHRNRPFTAIIDAIDESADPSQLINVVIRPLLTDRSGAIRLLLGTRPHLVSAMEPAPMRSAPTIEVINLDEPEFADQPAMTAFAIRVLLEANRKSPYLTVEPAHVRSVAQSVAERAAPSFLVARIVSTKLAAASAVADPADATWRATLPSLPGQAMNDDLNARLGHDAQRARDLLRPLAYAHGQGLPWEDIWAPLASRVSGKAYTDADLLWLRQNAGSYIVEATEYGRSVYRLYHQALAEHLRFDSHNRGLSDTSIHQAFTDGLTRIPRDTSTTARDWTRAHPYTLQHLATHAAEAGRIDDVIADLDFLCHANPDTLLTAFRAVTTNQGRLLRAIYRASASRHRSLTPQQRRYLLAVDAARYQAKTLRQAFARSLTYAPLWATESLCSFLCEVLSGH